MWRGVFLYLALAGPVSADVTGVFSGSVTGVPHSTNGGLEPFRAQTNLRLTFPLVAVSDNTTLRAFASLSIDRDAEPSDKLTFGIELRRRFLGGHSVTASWRYSESENLLTDVRSSGVQFGLDHGLYRQIRQGGVLRYILSGWSNIRSPASLSDGDQNVLFQGRYELARRLPDEPLGATPYLFGGVGLVRDSEKLSYNNKFTLDAGARLSWRLEGGTSLSLSWKATRDRRFVSDVTYFGLQFGLSWRRVF